MGSDAGNLHQIERKQRITWALKWWDAWWDLLGLWHAMNSHILGLYPSLNSFNSHIWIYILKIPVKI